MKKIKNLEALKNLDKNELVEEMLKGTIRGGSSCANIPNTGFIADFNEGPTNMPGGGFDPIP